MRVLCCRTPLTSIEVFYEVNTAVECSLRFIEEDLPMAAGALGQANLGPTFQALVAHGLRDGDEADTQHEGGPARLATEASPVRKRTSAMYAGRTDNAAAGRVDLTGLPGGARGLKHLASAAASLVKLLRLKIEDDGDLGRAEKTLQECAQFFEDLDRIAHELGDPGPYATLRQLQGVA